jgi:YggT family protein
MIATVLTWSIRAAFNVYVLCLIARAVLPMLGMSYAHPVMRFLWNVTEPLLAPLRRRLPIAGPLDWSPLVLILLLWVAEGLLLALVQWAL